MKTRLLFVHFTPPGVIGGVEHILEQHAGLLARRGFEVCIVAGRRGRSPYPVHVIPDIDAARPGPSRIESELAQGIVSPSFERSRERILAALRPLAADCDFLVVHNAFTLHFSLPLTAAVWEIAAERAPGSSIAWCHDVSWTNPLYRPTMHEGYPWDLLRAPAPNTLYVAISTERAIELRNVWRQDS